MTDLLSRLPLVLVRDLGWTLIHFLWQGLLLAALLNAILPLCRGAVARHNWALGTLAMMVLAPVATFLFIHDFETGGATVLQAAGAPGLFAPASVSLPWIGWLVVFWLVGIAVLSLRAIGGWYVAGQLGRQDTLALPAELLQRCHVLQRRLAVTGPVRFLLSRRVPVPVVIGWLRPLILIPISAMAGLAPQQLDALILHELAHIRRLDTVINVMLVAVETILFYHPAVWWVSRRVRIEREHCCDDFAVSACGDAAVYVEALTSLETWKAMGLPVLAASGGRLKYRVGRLLGAPPESRRFSPSAIAGLAFLGLVVGTVATAQTNSPMSKPRFAIRVVDESVGKDTLHGPKGDDRVRMAKPDKGMPGSLWLKRESQIDGAALAEAHVSTGRDGKPVVELRLTPNGGNQFAKMTRDNIGHRLAVVMNDTVITAPTVLEPILGGKAQITGQFTTEAEANGVVAEMMGTSHPVKPAMDTRTPPPHPAESPKGTNLQPISGTHTFPPYPKQSADRKEQGSVKLAVTIGTDGAVSHASVEKSSGHQGLDTQAADYVKSYWRWQPPTRNGKPVVATTKVVVVFQLKAQPASPDKVPGPPGR